MKQVTTELVTDYIDAIMDDYVDWCGKQEFYNERYFLLKKANYQNCSR